MKIEDVEKQFVDTAKLNGFIQQLDKPLEKVRHIFANVNDLDKWTQSFFKGHENELETLLVRSYVLGIFLASETHKMRELPKPDLKVIKTTRQQEALEYVKARGAIAIQGATNATAQKVKEIVLDGIVRNQGWRQISNTLRKEIQEEGDIGRWWQRVAITEVNSALNNGYLATKEVGDFLLGTGFADACDPCKEYVIGKIVKVGEPPKESFDNLDPLSKEYKNLQKYWEDYVWVGKTNIGRAAGKTKVVNGEKGERLPHEMYAIATPLHPNCRCRWVQIFPNLVYVNSKGDIVPVTKQNEDKWKAWHDELIKRYAK